MRPRNWIVTSSPGSEAISSLPSSTRVEPVSGTRYSGWLEESLRTHSRPSRTETVAAARETPRSSGSPPGPAAPTTTSLVEPRPRWSSPPSRTSRVRPTWEMRATRSASISPILQDRAPRRARSSVEQRAGARPRSRPPRSTARPRAAAAKGIARDVGGGQPAHRGVEVVEGLLGHHGGHLGADAEADGCPRGPRGSGRCGATEARIGVAVERARSCAGRRPRPSPTPSAASRSAASTAQVAVQAVGDDGGVGRRRGRSRPRRSAPASRRRRAPGP